MRTACAMTISPSMLCAGGGCLLQGWGVCSRGAAPGGGYPSIHWGRPPCEQNHTRLWKHNLAPMNKGKIKWTAAGHLNLNYHPYGGGQFSWVVWSELTFTRTHAWTLDLYELIFILSSVDHLPCEKVVCQKWGNLCDQGTGINDLQCRCASGWHGTNCDGAFTCQHLGISFCLRLCKMKQCTAIMKAELIFDSKLLCDNIPILRQFWIIHQKTEF